MKNIWLILFLILTCEVAFCQTIVPRANSSITVQDARFSAQYNLFVPRYADTTAANLSTNEGIDTLGAIIFTYDNMSLMVRKYDSGKKWSAIGGGGGAGTVTSVGITGSDFSISGSPVTTSGNISLTLATVNGNVGSFGSATQAGTFTVNGKGLITAAGNTTITPAVGSITGLGTGVATALGVNVGTAGSFVVNGGALGTPSSGVATNLTGTATALNIGGNAATATILQTARNIQGVSFNGSAAIDIINGTGFVKATGTTISYDNSTYVTGNIYTVDGTLSGTRTVELGGNELIVTESANNLLYITDGQSSLRSFNPTGSDNTAGSAFVTGATLATFGINAYFNGSAKYSEITALADVDSSIINYTSDKHVFVGDVVLFELAGNGAGVVAVDNNGLLSWSAAGGGNTIYTGDDDLAGNRIVGLAGNFLKANNGSDEWLTLDPDNGIAGIRASDATLGNYGSVRSGAFPTYADYSITADYNDNQTRVSIDADADTDLANLSHLARYTGGIEAKIELSATVASSSITSTADSQTFIAEGQSNGLISLGSSFIKAFNPQDDGNYSTLSVATTTTDAYANFAGSFNDGVKSFTIIGNANASSSSITSTADLHTITGAVSIVGVTTLTGNLLAIADNTYDIGDATNSFQDIFSRTLVLDGSTSGTVTLASDAVAKSFRATTLTGEGYVSTNSITVVQSASALSDVNTEQPAFGSAQDLFTLQGSTLYEFEVHMDITSGTNAHSVAFSIVMAGGASINWIKYTCITGAAAINTNTTAIRIIEVNQATATTLNASGANARQFHTIKGFISVNAAGTFVPSITFSAAPGATNEMNIGSYCKFTPVGVNSTATVGPVN